MSDKHAFTLRIDNDLHMCLKARMKVSIRSLNAEVNYLLRRIIDEGIQTDLDLIKRMSDPTPD
jgi:hypothetical protein